MSQFQTLGLGVGGLQQVCLLGLVLVPQPQLLGATNGLIITLQGRIIPLTQVVGPTGGPVSLAAANGQFAIVCGSFALGTQTLVVNQVVPLSLLR